MTSKYESSYVHLQDILSKHAEKIHVNPTSIGFHQLYLNATQKDVSHVYSVISLFCRVLLLLTKESEIKLSCSPMKDWVVGSGFLKKETGWLVTLEAAVQGFMLQDTIVSN